MPDQDRESRTMRREPLEGRLQVDPMLRRGRVRWGWGVAAAAAIAVFAIILFATNREADIAKAPPAEPPITTSESGPMPPETSPTSRRGTANVPPASTNAERVPPGAGETTGQGQ